MNTKINWIKVEDRLPTAEDDNNGIYVYEYGKVRDDVEWCEWCVDWDTCSVPAKSFATPNSDPEYGGIFKTDGVTHWAPKILPEPPIS